MPHCAQRWLSWPQAPPLSANGVPIRGSAGESGASHFHVTWKSPRVTICPDNVAIGIELSFQEQLLSGVIRMNGKLVVRTRMRQAHDWLIVEKCSLSGWLRRMHDSCRHIQALCGNRFGLVTCFLFARTID